MIDMLTGASGEREEHVVGLAGDDVSLSCSVDVGECGDFHSIKWYRDNQRVFLFSELANLERGEGALANRWRMRALTAIFCVTLYCVVDDDGRVALGWLDGIGVGVVVWGCGCGC